MTNRRNFLQTTFLAGAGLTLNHFFPAQNVEQGKKIGIIGLDTSHCIAFTKALNLAADENPFKGYKVVAAYPKGSLDIKSSVDRIDGYTKEIQQYGVQIVDSIEALLNMVDVVLLETNDGRRHLEQAIPVLKAGKRMFIDKPMAASLLDARVIFGAAQRYGVPVFSSSSLRYITGMKEIREGSAGKILGAETYSPCTLEKTHPDLFWYGIHGVETLFTAMGTGCRSVVRVTTTDTEMAIGTWEDNRIGSFRGLRKGAMDYGGLVFGEKGIVKLGPYAGYNPLLVDIIRFFESGIPPVQPEETLEILAFMECADISRDKGGKTVNIPDFMEKTEKESLKILKNYNII